MDHPAEQPRGNRPPDQQHEHAQRRLRRQHPVGECARFLREQPTLAEGDRRIAARRSPFQVEAGSAAVLPVVDLQPVGARVELHRAHGRGHADLGVPFDHDLAVQAHYDAVVGGGVKVDPFRAGGIPDPVPAHQVVPRGAILLVDERKVDRGDSFFDDRGGQHFEDRFGRAIGRGVRIVVAARESGGRCEAARDQPEDGERDRSRQVPAASSREGWRQTAAPCRQAARAAWVFGHNVELRHDYRVETSCHGEKP